MLSIFHFQVRSPDTVLHPSRIYDSALHAFFSFPRVLNMGVFAVPISQRRSGRSWTWLRTKRQMPLEEEWEWDSDEDDQEGEEAGDDEEQNNMDGVYGPENQLRQL